MRPIVQLDGGSASPIRILGPNADPNNPSFDDVIFDGNARSLRAKQRGVAYVNRNPGFYDEPGKYAGVPIAINNPHPTRRHIVLANGWVDGNSPDVRELPRQYGSTLTKENIPYFQQNGIGVATDERYVWGLNCNSAKALWTYWYSDWIQINPFDPSSLKELPHYRIYGYQSNYCYVSYLVLHNTIG